VDFRKGADSLAALAKETLAQDPFCGAVLVFRSRRAVSIRRAPRRVDDQSAAA
jgi:transposase